MPVCDTCGKETPRCYWWRGLPDICLCKVCWDDFEDVKGIAFRTQLARAARSLRRRGLTHEARKFLDLYRGTGVATNNKRGDRTNGTQRQTGANEPGTI